MFLDIIKIDFHCDVVVQQKFPGKTEFMLIHLNIFCLSLFQVSKIQSSNLIKI